MRERANPVPRLVPGECFVSFHTYADKLMAPGYGKVFRAYGTGRRRCTHVRLPAPSAFAAD
ncbi:hypothetical protein [Streptomyces sp. NPDC047706]|uniref:hypothetical protein n=1 Tax=Streptomyces sp. NPDC047706 TaxID=3365486 RepID=UPI003719F611